MKTARSMWSRARDGVLVQDLFVHEMYPTDFEYYSAWCGRTFTQPELHAKAQVVTCLWCLARKDR